MRRILKLLPATVLTAGVLAGAAVAKEHPTLVDVASTSCTDCHDDLWPAKAKLHPPVADDCTLCHEFTRDENGTQVGLMEEGTALCLVCHDEKTKAVEADFEVPHFPATDSCTTCHNPHGSEQPPLLVAPVPGLCADCHELDGLAASHGEQITPATSCVRCHDPHGADQEHMLRGAVLHPPFAEGSCKGCHREPFGTRVRLRTRGEKLCTSCHGKLRLPPPGDPTVHPALYGKGGTAGCLSCHDPHMSAQRRLLVAGGNDLCARCHAARVAEAAAKGGHPAAEDCLNCHNPHQSEHPPLLVEARGELCTLCHDLDDDDLRSSHLGADLNKLQCLRCHTPHGSEYGKLLAKNVHPPLLDGCDTCHDGSFDKFVESDKQAVCMICHDDVAAAAAAATVPHPALELGECVSCHNPHASPQRRLVKDPGAGPCLECHDEKQAAEGETQHGIIGLVGCAACHEPHGGENEHLLRVADKNELCLSCHDANRVQIREGVETVDLLGRFPVPAEAAAKAAILHLSPDGVRNHPVTYHRVLGAATAEELKHTKTIFEGELGCLTCHDPHKGGGRLFRWGAQTPMEACLHCHPR